MLKNMHELSFEYRSHGVALHPPGATFGPRNMTEYEFVWILEGDVEFECDDILYQAPAGTITLVSPGVRDAYRWDKKRQTRQPFFHFQMERNGAIFPDEKDWPCARQMPEGDIVRPLFRNLLWLADSDIENRYELIEGVIRQILVAFVTETEETRALGQVEFPLAVERCLTYVQSLWKEGKMSVPTLEELALESHVSSVHLCRLFEKEFGLAPMKAIRLLRLDRAALLLAKTNLSI